MLPLLLVLASRVASLAPCDDEPDHLRLSTFDLSPSQIVPGSELCVHFQAKPDVAVRQLQIRIDLPNIVARAAEYSDLCRVSGMACSAGNVSGTVCEPVPLAAMLLGGQRVAFTLRATDEAGAPFACVQGEAAVADAVAIDADIESMADAQVHHPLRRAITTAEGSTLEERAHGVRRLLQEAYEASPDWAEAFARWKQTHGRYLRAHDQDETPAAVVAEAKGFAQFRENVLSAVRSGRSISVDATYDQTPDHRRTLAHFS